MQLAAASPVAAILVVRQPFERKGKHVEPRPIKTAPGRSIGRGFLVALSALVLLAVALFLGPAASTPAAWGASEVFPVTIVDDEGTEVTIATEPQRIISLSPANTEITFALGAGDRLVGRTESDDYPAEATDLTPVASFSGVNMERLVALQPDLVLAGGNSFTLPDDIARMRELGYAVVVVYASDIPAVLADIELIGSVIGAAAEAESLTTQMAAQFDAITEAVAAVDSRPRTLYQVGSEPEIYCTSAGFVLGRHGDLCRRRPHHHQRSGGLGHPARGTHRGRSRGHHPR